MGKKISLLIIQKQATGHIVLLDHSFLYPALNVEPKASLPLVETYFCIFLKLQCGNCSTHNKL